MSSFGLQMGQYLLAVSEGQDERLTQSVQVGLGLLQVS